MAHADNEFPQSLIKVTTTPNQNLPININLFGPFYFLFLKQYIVDYLPEVTCLSVQVSV